jgi:PTH1 family peptidyl-tRNA hydrolase
MKIVCGLGNPGARYENTRHNAGFLICERVAARLGVFFTQKKFNSLAALGRHRDDAVLLLKPQTFMNRSGAAVAPAAHFYQVDPEDLLAIHDDADLPLGRVRLKQGGGNAGHKGLISIQEGLGSADFARLRFGIGRPEDPRFALADFVLADLGPEERRLLDARFDLAADATCCWLADGIDVAMNKFNGLASGAES